MKRVSLLTALVIIISFLLPKNVIARSGCCSYHGGVCGCGCCDGTPLSSTCAPYYPGCSQPVYVVPIVTKAPVIYTPKPSPPKPTVLPTQTPTFFPAPTLTLIPTVNPTSSPTLEPEVKSATTENTSAPIIEPEKTEASYKNVLLGLGIFVTIVGGLIWIIRKIVKKIISIFRK